MTSAWRILSERVDDWVNGFLYIVPNLLVGLFVALVFAAIAIAAAQSLRHGLRRAGRHDLGHLLSSFAFWGVLFIGFLVVITIILPSMKPADIFTSLGVGSVALGFAFKDILQNWLAGVFILIRRPFHRGDQIKIGDVEGTVQAVETRATLVKTYAGRLVIIPNTDVYTHSVTVNTAYPIRRVEIIVPVGMGVDLPQAIDAFRDATHSVEHVLTDPPADVLPWEFSENNINMRVRWWTKSQRSYEVRTRAAVVAAIKRVSDELGIDIPADTTISFADTPLIVSEQKLARPKAKAKATRKAALAGGDVGQPERVDEQRDPEAEKPKLGELNEGLEDVPR